MRPFIRYTRVCLPETGFPSVEAFRRDQGRDQQTDRLTHEQTDAMEVDGTLKTAYSETI